MLQLAHSIAKRGNIFLSIWIIYAYMLRQSVPTLLQKSFLLEYFVLILSMMLIQILYGSFLHTDRTSITSFIHIDTIEDTYKYDAERLALDISDCPSIFKDFKDYTVIEVAKNFNGLQNHSRYFNSGKCALFVSTFEFSVLMTGSCSVWKKFHYRHKPYLGPALGYTPIGFFINKKFGKDIRDHIDSWTYQSFEMGLEAHQLALLESVYRKFSEKI